VANVPGDALVRGPCGKSIGLARTGNSRATFLSAIDAISGNWRMRHRAFVAAGKKAWH